MNFFSHRTAARRYARGRPRFHPLVVGRVREFLSLTTPLARALDVGCGTGLSTVALKEVAASVVGADASAEMLALAHSRPGVRYVNCDAERLPFGAGAFDLLTVSQAFHWLDREKFFAEACRVLRAGRWLVVYDNYFSGEIEGGGDFRGWFRESYLARYPSPPRNWAAISEEDASRAGFRLLGHETLPNAETFTVETLTDYLLTQTNVIAAVEGRGDDVGAAKAWLAASARPLFGDRAEAKFLFDAPVWFLQRETPDSDAAPERDDPTRPEQDASTQPKQ